MKASGKLVRDRVPEIIRAAGLLPRIHIADPDEYHRRLRDKLREEVDEFVAAGRNEAPGELCDVLEVVYALAAELGLTRDRLEELRQLKAAERGGFADRVVWSGNVEED
ncbi:nucleoside triphosphate pyrophosphohydrolase [Streptomyces chartreusis]|uniref:nucleoside triphosphate pyrophosphohydrolase n=1 Tax=Streptomyces chartreusis TaxID=1969 RepID=UPI0035D71EA5